MIQTIISAQTAAHETNHPDYVLAPQVVLALADDGTGRLLDMGGNFYALSATAAAMLHETLRTTATAVATRMAARYQMDRSQVQEDLTHFLAGLEREALIYRAGHDPRGGKRKRLLAACFILPALRCIHAAPVTLKRKAQALMGLAYLAIRLLGWPAALTAWQRSYRKIPLRPEGSETVAAARVIDEAVRDAAARHPFNIECKERGLGCWALLRAQGWPAKLQVGIDLFPFASHCWCELGDQVLTDYEDRCERFTPVLTYR